MTKGVSSMTSNFEDVYRLSPIQQGLLYEQMNRPGDGVYVEQLVLTFAGTLNPELVHACWQGVVDRHPVLRTSFHEHGANGPLQVVHTSATLPMPTHDWRGISEEKQQGLLREWMAADRAEGFDIVSAPLMRIDLVQTEEQRWILLWRFSHLLMDGWSFGIAMQEFIRLYRARATGDTSDLVEARPYREYVSWWRKRDASAAQRFWREELADYQPGRALRVDPETPAPSEFPQTWVEIELGDLADRVREMAKRERLTANTVVHGAWMVLLGKYLGTSDVVCGATAAHRPVDLPGAETILGPMVVTLPIRCQIEPNRVVSAWLRDLQVTQVRAREHVELPLPDIQRELGLPHGVVLLESSVSFENVPMPDLTLPATGVEVVDLSYDGRPHFPLTLVILPGETMPLRIIADRRRIGHAAAKRLAEQMRVVLAHFADHPDHVLDEVRLLDEAGLQRTVEAWQPREPVVPTSATLDSRFREQVRTRPHQTALVCGQDRVDYAELDRRSDELAARLRERGVGVGQVVALCLERSELLVRSVIGVLKSGAAYVPLDPAAPAARLAELCADSGAAFVLASEETAGDLSPGPEVLRVEELGEGRTAAHGEHSEHTSTHPAYILYTSGSTGTPKGVRVTHANVLSLIEAGRQEFGFDEYDVWTCCHSITFDYSVWEIWGALANGGTCVLVPYWTARTPSSLHELVESERVTVLSQTPAAFAEFDAVDATLGIGLPALRAVFLGGERLDPSSLRGWVERHGATHPWLVNLYGLTETSVVATWHPITVGEIEHPGGSVIGRALPNCRVYLLDERLRPVPEGVVGELFVAGSAVACGYHGGSDSSAERFLPDPFHHGQRMFRTGDLARMTADGEFEYLGRIDQQVKLRGVRLEPGEVEAALRALEPVHAAVVTVREHRSGPRLVAYLVPEDEPVPAQSLLSRLRARLPAHAIPSTVCWVDEVPLTSSGKVDHSALPEVRDAPDTARFDVERVAPTGPVQSRLCEVVGEILELNEVGVTDDLTACGLHSLHAMRLVTKLRSEFGIEVSLREFLTSPTVETLDSLVREREEV
jgi:amino acid adenylation domain-containing protein